MIYRELRSNEYDLLKTFLYEAIYIPEGEMPPDRSIIELPELALYYEDFGTGPADHCMAAEDEGRIIGAVWTRIMNDYGHVDDDTPSLAISVLADYRGRGTGTILLQKIKELLKFNGYKRVSLAVQKANYAVRMYERAGFRTVGENAEEYIMVCDLQGIEDGKREMSNRTKVGISSFAYCFATGRNPFQKPEHFMTPFELIDKAIWSGAEVVQFGDNMPLEVYDDEVLEKIRIYAEERGIELEAGMRRTTAERLSEYILITQKIGAHILRVITDGGGFEPDFQECCRLFSSMIPQLEESDVTIGIENHDRFHAREYARMIETIGHPRIGLTVDTVNSLSLEETVEEVLRNMAPYCVCLHMKDYVIKRSNGGSGLKITGACPGTGRLDIRRCYEECLRQSARSFNIIIESWMEPCETLEVSLQTEDEWAKTGVAFLKNMLEDYR